MMIIVTIILLIIDIVSKLIVSNLFLEQVSSVVISNFLNITYVKNTGAAFSIMDDKSYLVLVISSLIIMGLILYVYKNRPRNNFEKVVYSMIIAGALGNLIDRIIYGYVIDFIDFTIFGYNYPIFNLADTFIVLGVILLMVYTWRCSDCGDKGIRK